MNMVQVNFHKKNLTRHNSVFVETDVTV